MAEKYPDWQSRLNKYIAEVQKKIPDGELDYGKFDCCIFVADAVVAMTGEDPFRKYRGKYKTKIGAGRMLKRLGGLREALGTVLGKEIHPSSACYGDVVFWDDACGICIGRNSLFLNDAGFTYIPTVTVEVAFHG